MRVFERALTGLDQLMPNKLTRAGCRRWRAASSELHRAMKETLPAAQRAGIMAELGLDEISFAGTNGGGSAGDACIEAHGEPVQAPHKFLGPVPAFAASGLLRFVSLSPEGSRPLSGSSRETSERLSAAAQRSRRPPAGYKAAAPERRTALMSFSLTDEALQAGWNTSKRAWKRSVHRLPRE